MSNVTFDHRSVLVDGRRTLVLSGAIHYPRSTPEMWPDLMVRTREAGLNTVETYVFWNLHERQKGVFDFSGRLDLRRFCRCAAEAGLHVMLRIGPYICAETNFGGFPSWLLREPGIQMRTYNQPFMAAMENWTRLLCDYIRPMFAPAGGPIILAQVENEYDNIAWIYGEEGKKYLQWSIDMGLSLDLGVPWVMCSGQAPGAISTINGYYAHQMLEKHFKDHPDQPALWTEAYPAWYNTFGYPPHERKMENLVYSIARFYAGGGTGSNYYMWHGGTNFGRETMFLQTTSYDFSAMLDEYGLTTTKYNFCGRLHRTLAENSELLLEGERSEHNYGKDLWAIAHRQGGRQVLFLCNDSTGTGSFEHEGVKHDLPPQSVRITDGGKVLFESWVVSPADKVARRMLPAPKPLKWESWGEPSVAGWPDGLKSPHTLHRPVEQLQFTLDQTDYCWYTATLNATGKDAKSRLKIDGGGDIFHVFVDGKRVASTQGPLSEDRVMYPQTDEVANKFTEFQRGGYTQSFELSLKPGKHELSILACAFGLTKGDWMIGNKNMANEKKGIWGKVTWNGKEITGWTLQPGLAGEELNVFSRGGAAVRWKPVKGKVSGLRWLRTTFTRPSGAAPLTVDLGGMTKGMIFLNGQCAGRYWLVEASGPSPEWMIDFVVHNPDPTVPTQRYYHLPLAWLQDENTLVLLEEVGGDLSSVRLCRKK